MSLIDIEIDTMEEDIDNSIVVTEIDKDELRYILDEHNYMNDFQGELSFHRLYKKIDNMLYNCVYGKNVDDLVFDLLDENWTQKQIYSLLLVLKSFADEKKQHRYVNELSNIMDHLDVYVNVTPPLLNSTSYNNICNMVSTESDIEESVELCEEEYNNIDASLSYLEDYMMYYNDDVFVRCLSSGSNRKSVTPPVPPPRVTRQQALYIS